LDKFLESSFFTFVRIDKSVKTGLFRPAIKNGLFQFFTITYLKHHIGWLQALKQLSRTVRAERKVVLFNEHWVWIILSERATKALQHKLYEMRFPLYFCWQFVLQSRKILAIFARSVNF